MAGSAGPIPPGEGEVVLEVRRLDELQGRGPRGDALAAGTPAAMPCFALPFSRMVSPR